MMYMHHMSRKLPFVMLGILGIIWGSNFLFMKMAVAHVQPIQVAWLRTLFGAVPILALAAATRVLAWRDWRHAHHFLVMALLANVGPYVFFVIGTKYLSSGIAGVISGAVPCITAVIVAVSLPTEKITSRKLKGLAIGFLGVLLVALGAYGDGTTQSDATLLGVFAMLVGSLSYALAIVYARRFINVLALSAVKLAAYQVLIACILLSMATSTGGLADLWADTPAALGLVVGLGIIGTGVAFVLYYYLIAKLGALAASTVYYIPPPVALLLGAAILGENVTMLQLAGMAAILVGIYLAAGQTTNEQRSNA